MPSVLTSNRRGAIAAAIAALALAGVLLLVAAVVGRGGSDPQNEPLADLQAWVDQVRHKAAAESLSDAAVEADAQRLRELVPPVEDELAGLSPSRAAAELKPFEDDLSRQLPALEDSLTPAQAFFFYTDLQYQLERLSDAARHARLLTGTPAVANGRVPSAAEIAAAHAGPHPAARLGIPPAYRARPDWNPGSVKPAYRPCFFVTESLPDFHTVAAAEAFRVSRGCDR